jgi:outer membrane protein assembly factor BamA
LALSLRTGFIIHLTEASQTPLHKRFWLGGRNTVRGFPEEGIIPVDQTSSEDQDSPCIPDPDSEKEKCLSVGGDAYLIIRGELRFPLIPETLEGAFFADLGNLWIDPVNLDPLDLRPTAGFGIRYLSPIGPVAFDFGFNLDPDEDRREESWSFHFNIGVF